MDEFLDPPAEARAAGAAPISADALRAAHQLPQHAAGGRARRAPRPRARPATSACAGPTTTSSRRCGGTRTATSSWSCSGPSSPSCASDGFAGPRVAVLSPHGNEGCAAAQLTEQPWRDRLAPLVGSPARGRARRRTDGDWLTSCIPSDLDAVDLHSGKIKYSSIYRFKGLEAPAVVITDVDALDTPAQRSLLYVGCTRALQRLVILADEKCARS